MRLGPDFFFHIQTSVSKKRKTYPTFLVTLLAFSDVPSNHLTS